MTHYEQRLEEDLNALRLAVLGLAGMVRANLGDAVAALLGTDHDLAYRTILKDGPVNRATEQLDDLCHRFIARHLPAAGHLRLVSAVMRMGVLLERMGDYSVTICRESVQLAEPLGGPFGEEVGTMARDSLVMFDKAMTAFDGRDASLARSTMADAERVDRDFSEAFGLLLSADVAGLGMLDVFGRLIVIMQLERVSDQAKNLCEETVFAITGETKRRRPVRVLFLDGQDDGNTQIAVAVGRKQHPRTGIFSSASARPSGDLSPDVIAFLDAHGFDTASLSPTGITWSAESWAEYDVIVGLDEDVGRFVDRIPFHTVALRWNVSSHAATVDERYRFLSNAVGELMETMRGSEPTA